MKNVTLIFPDVTSLADFLMKYKPSNTEINTAQRTLSGELLDDLIVVACTEYKAHLKPVYSFFPFDE